MGEVLLACHSFSLLTVALFLTSQLCPPLHTMGSKVLVHLAISL